MKKSLVEYTDSAVSDDIKDVWRSVRGTLDIGGNPH
jgi:hypothetical protein